MSLDMYLWVEKTAHEGKGVKNLKTLYPKELQHLGQKCWLAGSDLVKHERYLVGYWCNFYPFNKCLYKKNGQQMSEDIYLEPTTIKTIIKDLERIKENKHGIFYDFDLGNQEQDKQYYLECLDYSIALFKRVLNFIKKNPRYDIWYNCC